MHMFISWSAKPSEIVPVKRKCILYTVTKVSISERKEETYAKNDDVFHVCGRTIWILAIESCKAINSTHQNTRENFKRATGDHKGSSPVRQTALAPTEALNKATSLHDVLYLRDQLVSSYLYTVCVLHDEERGYHVPEPFDQAWKFALREHHFPCVPHWDTHQ